MKQIEIHNNIDIFLKGNPEQSNPVDLTNLIAGNSDAVQYFFSVADERWLDWLWSNGFLDVIKKNPENLDNNNYWSPEISYLGKIAANAPEEITAIILYDELATKKDKLNPGLVDEILRICEKLPQDQLALIVPKIHDQEWTKVMELYNRWGFEYERIFRKLADAKDYKSLLLLADSVLAIRTKTETDKKEHHFGSINPFYFNELSYTKVFEYLANAPDEFAEQTLALVSDIISKIVMLGGSAKEEEVFPIHDSFYLFDVDFFTLELDEKKPLSYRDDVRELLAVMKILVTRLFGGDCVKNTRIREFYEHYIATLPDSRAMWRFRLYVFSLCPQIFATELQAAYFRLFKVDKYYDIISGTEYEKTLSKGFSYLSIEEKESYVDDLIKYFGTKANEHPDQEWHMQHGSEILTMIQDELTASQKEKAFSAGFTFIKDYQPEPSIHHVSTGAINTHGPINQDEFNVLPLAEIAKKLRADWSPKVLREADKSDDFFNRLNGEGVGNLIRNDVAKRLQEYVTSSGLFFEPGVLDAHYTYSYFRGIEGAIKDNRPLAKSVDWKQFIAVCLSIAKPGARGELNIGRREREVGEGWLSGWDSVHSSIADILQILLQENNGELLFDFEKYRKEVFDMISYLLAYPDPVPKDEEPETATIKFSSGNDPQLVGDPFTAAINSVRGRAFQVLVLFIYLDGKQFDKKASVRISEDVKALYAKVLKSEDTRAIMFMFGHYLPQFYYRDIQWIQGLLPDIFPEAPEKSHLFLAAWEGYLANNLYREIFDDPQFQRLYLRTVNISGIKESGRRYFRDPDEGMATHIALAFIHYENARLDSLLFKKFWEEGDIDQKKEFVGFIGRSVVSGKNASIDNFLKNNPSVKDLLKSLWDWVLEHEEDSDVLKEFGFWSNIEKGLFDIDWLASHIRRTLEKTNGIFDWDYGLTQICVQLSKEAPEDTLEITRLFFVNGGINAGHRRRPFYVEREWFDVFKNLIENPATKARTAELIDELIRIGGQPFWGLKSLVEE